MGGYYMQYLQSLCRRRGWTDPAYECYREHAGGFTCLVLVNGREYQTDLAYESNVLAQENAAMRAFMVCQNFSANGGMLVRNGVVQGIPSAASSSSSSSSSAAAAAAASASASGPESYGGRRRKSRHHSSSSSTASFDARAEKDFF